MKSFLTGKHMVPLTLTDDKRVRPVVLVQVIPLVLAMEEAFTKGECGGANTRCDKDLVPD